MKKPKKIKEERLLRFADGEDTPTLEESIAMAMRLLYLEEAIAELKQLARVG